MTALPFALDPVRYEVLPFGRADEAAADISEPLTLTVTCSPRHGVDMALEAAARLRSSEHRVVLHLAARMVRGRGHLDELLDTMRLAELDDVFLVGGDAERPLGPYASGVDLLPDLRDHPHAPLSVGVPAYPEGHPLIGAAAIARALAEKAALADYMTSQMCFDAEAIIAWLERTRESDIRLPLLVGVPGAVDRRRLLEVSRRVGVGASMAFVRKQRGVRTLLARPLSATEDLCRRLSERLRPEHEVAGLHFFTFDRLAETTALAARLAEQTANPFLWGGVAPTGPPHSRLATDKEHDSA